MDNTKKEMINPVSDDMPVTYPIDGILDLHMFAPTDVRSLVDEYITVCRELGLYEIKIIHGKGKGALRRTVHALLDKHPFVSGFHLDEGPSGWGATITYLRPDPLSK